MITSAGKPLYDLDSHLHANIIGQGHIIPRIVSCIERGEMGIAPDLRPKGNFLFLGPTGVGKTETTILFSEYLFGPGSYHRFNMSEFQHEDTLENFIGNESGELGRLGRLLSTTTSGVILFDEVEKAHPRILDLFLQILEPGEITCGKSQTFSLKGFYMVLTSNAGSSRVVRSNRSDFETIQKAVLNDVMSQFRKEFCNRFHEMIVFDRLSPDHQRQIAELHLKKEILRLGKLGYSIESSPEVLEFICSVGTTKTLGARPMQNAIIKYVGNAVCLAIREGNKGGKLSLCPNRNILILT